MISLVENQIVSLSSSYFFPDILNSSLFTLMNQYGISSFAFLWIFSCFKEPSIILQIALIICYLHSFKACYDTPSGPSSFLSSSCFISFYIFFFFCGLLQSPMFRSHSVLCVSSNRLICKYFFFKAHI